MTRLAGPLAAPVQTALEELQRPRLHCEVFARAGEIEELRRDGSGVWERRHAREVGVACRVAGAGRVGFAAASGGGARAGYEAARAAMAFRVPSRDPLPPREVLGATPVPSPPAPCSAGEREAFAHALAGAVAAYEARVTLAELRVLEGRAASLLATSEAFVARSEAAAAVVELLLAPPDGPWRLMHTASPTLRHLDPTALAERACEIALLAQRGEPPHRQLADVLLAPAVAAPLVSAIAIHLCTGPSAAAASPARAPRLRVSPLWRLVDERCGPAGLFPLPCDGEGLPARSIVLLADGRQRERLVSWEDGGRGGEAGGAVRPSFREPPASGPANLVVVPIRPLSQPELLARLEHGFYLASPALPLRVEGESGRFALRAAAVAIRRGTPVARHPLVELRGSLRRLLSGLLATGDDSESFSLNCAVTTPSLLFHGLEVA